MLNPEWRAGRESGWIIENQLGDIFRMKAVYVFPWIQCPNDGSLVDLFWWRRLHQNAVHGWIGVQFLHLLQKFGLTGGGRQFDLHRVQAEVPAHLVLRSHVGAGCRIIAYQYD